MIWWICALWMHFVWINLVCKWLNYCFLFGIVFLHLILNVCMFFWSKHWFKNERIYRKVYEFREERDPRCGFCTSVKTDQTHLLRWLVVGGPFESPRKCIFLKQKTRTSNFFIKIYILHSTILHKHIHSHTHIQLTEKETDTRTHTLNWMVSVIKMSEEKRIQAETIRNNRKKVAYMFWYLKFFLDYLYKN